MRTLTSDLDDGPDDNGGDPMQRSRQEFIDRYKYRLAALILFMQAEDVKGEGAVTRASRIYDMPATIEQLLGAMYDENVPAGNGKATAASPAVGNGRK